MKRILPFFVIPFFVLFLCVGSASAINWTTGMYAEEDTDTNVDEVGPGYGGQYFDVERIGIVEDGTNVYFMLQTGFDLVNGYGGYAPGDFALDINGDDLFDYAIDFSFSNPSGFSLSGTSGPGSVTMRLIDMSNGTWEDPQYYGIGDFPFRVNSVGSVVDNTLGSSATYDWTGNSGTTLADGFGNNTNYLEGFFDMNLLSNYDGSGIKISWTMGCGNDVLQHSTSVPEPATMLLLGTGLIGLAGLGRKRYLK